MKIMKKMKKMKKMKWVSIVSIVVISFLGLFGNFGCHTNPPTPPSPPPLSAQWKCPMFFPHKLYGTEVIPLWGGNQGSDSNQGYVEAEGNSWADQSRINGFQWVQGYGGNTTMFIAEAFYGHLDLQMRLGNRKDVAGNQNPAFNNYVVKARDYGIQRWIVSLFYSPGSQIPSNKVEDYIAEMAACYNWATSNQVAFQVSLECDRTMTPQRAVDLAHLVKKYSPDKRVIVGASNLGFLQSVGRMDSSIELWVEADGHPFNVNMSNADAYLAKCQTLKNTTSCKVWAGEYCTGMDVTTLTYITKKATEMGCDMGCGYFK